MAPPKLEQNWSTKFESEKSMAFFLMEGSRRGYSAFKVYLINKDTLEMYHVMDFPDTHPNLGQCGNIGCVFDGGKLYMVADRHESDVHVCDLLNQHYPYVWKRGPSMGSVKPDPHLVAYNGMVFVLSNPPSECNVNPMYTFEVWDTRTGCWVALPDPPLKDFNLATGLYKVVSHTILDGLIYFVFDCADNTESVVEMVGIACRTRPRFRSTRVEAFDPNLRQWVPSSSTINVTSDDEDNIDYNNYNYEDEESHDMLSLYLDFSARRHERGVRVMEFFEGDPSLRMFLIDPTGGIPLTPCFYTYDLSTFDPKDMLTAVRDFPPPCLSDIRSCDYLNWFQEFARPYLSSVTGLASLVQMLKHQPKRARRCFVLPLSYHQNCWSFCVVAFTENGSGSSCVIAKFRLKMLNSFRATADDVEMRIEDIPNTFACISQAFYRIP